MMMHRSECGVMVEWVAVAQIPFAKLREHIAQIDRATTLAYSPARVRETGKHTAALRNLLFDLQIATEDNYIAEPCRWEGGMVDVNEDGIWQCPDCLTQHGPEGPII